MIRIGILAAAALALGIQSTAAQTHFTFTENTGNNCTIALPASAQPSVGGAVLIQGDEIGAFTPGGLCVGALVWTGANGAVVVWGDDEQTPATDGIQANEAVTWRIWHASSGIEYSPAYATYSSGSGLYQPDGICVLASLTAGATGIGEQEGVPGRFTLEQNYPNPFNPETNIRFRIQAAGFTTLTVHDLLGRVAATLIAQEMTPGRYSAAFDAGTLASGAYFYTLRNNGTTSTRSMVLAR